ncbi:metallopeptidase [Candidatus Microgenomates bacterium]|nr:metallopeptidase [Candidatus Microgenomates bacterium]
MDWFPAHDVQKVLTKIVFHLDFQHVKTDRIICFRSFGSKTRAQARIWSLPRVWQLALSIPSAYVIEVIAERFDKLSEEEQKKVIIHELLHIPKNFSGALLPHRGRGEGITHRRIERLFKVYQESLKEFKK